MRFSYQSEKFAAARRALMLPHLHGEHESIAEAFRECSHGLHRLDRSELDDAARTLVRRLEAYLDTSNVSDGDAEGRWSVKARSFTEDEKIEISRTVDELASWFEQQFWGDD